MATQLAELDYNISSRFIDGIKEDKKRGRSTHIPSTASPGSILNVQVPKLDKDTVLFPNSLDLVFNYKTDAGATEDDVPDHLVNAIIETYTLKIKGNTVHHIPNFHHYAIYKELWKSEEDYENSAGIGIQTSDDKKQRHLGENKVTQPARVYGERYRFNLGHFLTESAFSPQSIHNDIEITLKLMSGKYKLENIELEYDYIHENSIANQISNKHSNMVYYTDNVDYYGTEPIKQAAGKFEIDILASFDSLRGVLILYKNTEKPNIVYENPNITNLKIDIDGKASEIYGPDYLPEYAWMSASKYFRSKEPCHINFKTFYSDKYCTFVDFRTIDNENAYGIGKHVNRNIKLKFTKDVCTNDVDAFIYLIYDKKVIINNNMLASIVS